MSHSVHAAEQCCRSQPGAPEVSWHPGTNAVPAQLTSLPGASCRAPGRLCSEPSRCRAQQSPPRLPTVFTNNISVVSLIVFMKPPLTCSGSVQMESRAPLCAAQPSPARSQVDFCPLVSGPVLVHIALPLAHDWGLHAHVEAVADIQF